MTAIYLVIVCVAALLWQSNAHAHERSVKADETRLSKLEARVSILEKQGAGQYSHAAFEELKTKVEGIRISQGLKGVR